MLKSPPMFPTHKTPEDIVGRSNMPLFEKFYSIVCLSTNNGEFPDKALNKAIGVDDRVSIAGTLQELRDNGFYPNGVRDNGSIKWGVMTKTKGQVLMEKGLKDYEKKSKEELMYIARSGYRPLIENVDVGKVSRDEIDFQRESQ